MADLIDIEFGDQRIRVPAWATEATLEAVMKYNEISARALNKLVGVETDGKKTFRVQEHYFKQIVDELQQTKKKQQELISQSKQEIKTGKEQVKAQVRATNKPTTKQDKTDYSKAFSDLSKSYSTSVDLLERSLLYLSKSLVDFNIILTKTSKTFEDMFKNIKGTSGATASNAGNTGSSNTSNRTRGSRINPADNRVRERRDPSFMSEYTALVEDYLEKGIKPTEKLVKNIEKALQFTKIKELDKKDITDLKSAIEKLSAGAMPDPATIQRMSDALDNYSKYDKQNIKITEELKNYYLRYTNSTMTDAERNREISRDIIKSQERLTRGMMDLASSFGEGSIKGMATAAGSIIGLGTVAGIAGEIFENFIKNISVMANVSVGFGQSLDVLRLQASQAGLNLDSYTKLVSENSLALKAFGNSTQDGAIKFSLLSENLRASAADFNMFGLSNTEYNEILAQEIEMRRKSGMDSFQINNLVNTSMNELVYQTTMLSALTGKSSRDLRRTMQEAMNDSLFADSMGKLSQTSKEAAVNLDTAVKGLGTTSPAMAELTKAMITSMTTGIDFRSGLSEDLRNAVSLIGPDAVDTLFNYIETNFKTAKADEFTAGLLEAAGGITTAIEANTSMAGLAQVGVGGAKTALDMKVGLSGIADNFNEAMKIQEETAVELAKSEGLGLPSALEDAVNVIKSKAISAVMDTLNIGDIGDAKTFLIDFANNVKDKGILGGLYASFGDLNTNTQLLIGSFAALSVAATVLPAGIAAYFGTRLVGKKIVSTTASVGTRALGAIGFNAGPSVPSSAARNMMGFARPAAVAGTSAAVTAAAVPAAAVPAAVAGTSAAVPAAAVPAAAVPAAAVPAAAVPAVAKASGLFSKFLVNMPLIGDILTGYIHGSETGSIGRGIFAGVGSLAARTGAAAAGTATTGVGGVLIQGAASVAGGYGGAELYDYLFGGDSPSDILSENMTENMTSGPNFNEMIATYLATMSTTTIDSNYKLGYILEESMQSTILIRDSLSVHANTTNVWLRNLNGISETIRDDISQIKTNNNSLSNNNGNLQNNASQNSESMLLLMSETNRLLQSLVRKYDESVQ